MGGFNIGAFFDDVSEYVASGIESVDEALDFGFDDADVEAITRGVDSSDREAGINYFGERGRTNPEVDLTEVDRANPTNTNFPGIGGIPRPVLYVGAAILGLAVLKMTKVI